MEKIQKARGPARAYNPQPEGGLARAELFTARPGLVSGRALKKSPRAGPRPTLTIYKT
jgi:hypothetical protein